MRKNKITTSFLHTRFSSVMTCLIVLFAWLNVHAESGNFQKLKITLTVKNELIEKVIDKIESVSDYRFVYNVKDVDLSRKVSLTVKNQNIDEVLKILFKNTSTIYKATALRSTSEYTV